MSNTGRHTINYKGRTFVVEPIDNTQGKGRKGFGDINPATKKVEGSYGDKYIGSVHMDDSIISEKNGFTNIHLIDKGDPYSMIKKIVDEKK